MEESVLKEPMSIRNIFSLCLFQNRYFYVSVKVQNGVAVIRPYKLLKSFRLINFLAIKCGVNLGVTFLLPLNYSSYDWTVFPLATFQKSSSLRTLSLCYWFYSLAKGTKEFRLSIDFHCYFVNRSLWELPAINITLVTSLNSHLIVIRIKTCIASHLVFYDDVNVYILCSLKLHSWK